MTHVITALCLRDNGCADVCPVECIQAGTPAQHSAADIGDRVCHLAAAITLQDDAGGPG